MQTVFFTNSEKIGFKSLSKLNLKTQMKAYRLEEFE